MTRAVSPPLELPTASPADLAVLEGPRRRWRWWVGAAVLAAAGLGTWAATRTGAEPEWETALVTRGPLVQKVTAVGPLEPLQSVEIGSDLTGTLSEVLVDENATVHKGDVLARLEPDTFENTVQQAEAAARSARAAWNKAAVEQERAVQERERSGRLVERGAATRLELDEATLTARAAAASVAASWAAVQQAEASLARARQDLGDTVITTPIDGVVIHRWVEPGQTVVSSMSATSLFEVATDLRALSVEVEVDEADIGLVQVGQPASFTVSAWPERTFDATVQGVDLAADDAATVVVYGTELRVDNADGALRPGMTVTAEIQVGRIDDALLVPAAAMRYRPQSAAEVPSGDHLWTVAGEQLVATPVRVLGSDGTSVAVEGVSEGAAVVIGGAR
ncbi:MAG: efflux RND transporter periplasmic adaptor subunit [Myxococcota bacterium]